LPLWFGNQDRDDESNPIYGTAKVLLASAVGLSPESVRRGRAYLIRSQNSDGGWGGGSSISAWLGDERGITSSVEETALALEALIGLEISAENSSERNLDAVSGVLHQQSQIQADKAKLRLSQGDTVQDGEIVRNHKGTGNSSARNANANNRGAGKSAEGQAIIRGVEFLLERVDDGGHRVSWPIGFYFAKLWYHERLYPLIFTTSAIGKFLRWAAVEGCTTVEDCTAAEDWTAVEQDVIKHDSD
jgi:squalene-hopene/tetraprenyl-beta-curcumene cyclase